ncbi:hypothetical protein ABIB85_008181 [Bradyrhizobium sp. JR1.5]
MIHTDSPLQTCPAAEPREPRGYSARKSSCVLQTRAPVFGLGIPWRTEKARSSPSWCPPLARSMNNADPAARLEHWTKEYATPCRRAGLRTPSTFITAAARCSGRCARALRTAVSGRCIQVHAGRMKQSVLFRCRAPESAAPVDRTGADRSRHSSGGHLSGMLVGPFRECLHRQAARRPQCFRGCGEGGRIRHAHSGLGAHPFRCRSCIVLGRFSALEPHASADACCRCRRRSRPRCRRSSSSLASIGDGANGWHGAVQRQRALKVAAGRRMSLRLKRHAVSALLSGIIAGRFIRFDRTSRPRAPKRGRRSVAERRKLVCRLAVSAGRNRAQVGTKLRRTRRRAQAKLSGPER